VQYDIITLTILYFAANIINFIPAMSITMRLLGGNLFEVIARLIGPGICSGIMFTALYWLLHSPHLNIVINSVFSLICISFFGAFVYFIASMIFLRDRIVYFKKALFKKA